MRADSARAVAFLALVLVGSCVAFAVYSYSGARQRVATEEASARQQVIAENELLRKKVIQSQPEVYVPPAPIVLPAF